MEYQKEFAAEQQYLDRTLGFIRENLAREEAACSDEKEQIVSARKEMWENVSFRGGFDNAVEAHQVLESIQAQSGRYDAAHKRIDHYRQSLESPYFARVDFTESGYESSPPEKIYIGLFTVQDEDSYETYVYDWRTPIASLFYRYETGPAQFQAPSGVIKGEVSLKRQFEIQDGKLSYFFDSDVNITDGMLREALSHNASPQMRSIVETIQRQQDRIIRDMLAFDRLPTDGTGRRLRIYYCTQSAAVPPTFIFFVNDPSIVTKNFENHLSRKIREAGDFDGVPLRLFWRSSHGNNEKA